MLLIRMYHSKKYLLQLGISNSDPPKILTNFSRSAISSEMLFYLHSLFNVIKTDSLN